MANDLDILTDFIALPNQAIDGNCFTFTNKHVLFSAPWKLHEELLFVIHGSLHVGFFDTTNNLLTETFANAGTVSLQTTLFATDIDDTILVKTFRIDDATIQALKASFAPKA
ncbi:hypothetical protein ACFE04_029550 [Oxalis oulophora]